MPRFRKTAWWGERVARMAEAQNGTSNRKENPVGRSRLSFRPMRFEDVPLVVEWEKRLFPNPWAPQHFVAEISNSGVSVPLVLEWDGEFAGYAVAWLVADELHIANIAVVPKFRRRGVATATIEHLLGLARRRGCTYAQLEVRASNAPAIALYRKLGFRTVGVRRGYYEKPREDALVMAKEL